MIPVNMWLLVIVLHYISDKQMSSSCVRTPHTRNNKYDDEEEFGKWLKQTPGVCLCVCTSIYYSNPSIYLGTVMQGKRCHGAAACRMATADFEK